MSHIETTKADLLDAIISSGNNVIALVGHWGVGKTFLWDQVRKENGALLKTIKPNYAYVSLFGLSTIAEVRSALFSQFASITVDDASRGEKSKNALAPYLEKVQQLASKAEGLWKLGAAGVGAAVELMKVNCIHDMLVCFDDFERADPSLRSIQILGLINELTTIRKCKVLLILNDEKLGSEGEGFREYTERVIDKLVRFEPSHAHALQVAVQDPATRALMAPFVAQLGCRNIRVIRKMSATLDEIARRTGVSIDASTPGVVSSVCLLTYCHLVRETSVPTVSEVLQVEYVSVFSDDDSESDVPRTFLRGQGWHEVDKCDRLVGQLVSRGVSEWDDLKREIMNHSTEIARGQKEQCIRDLWSSWTAKFMNEAESRAFALQVVEVMTANMEVVGAREIDEACQMLQTILDVQSARALLDEWKRVHQDNAQAFDLRGIEVFGKLHDEEFRGYLLSRMSEIRAPQTEIADLLAQCFTNKSWDGDSFSQLVTATASEYAESFRNAKDARLAIKGWLLLVNADPVNADSMSIYRAGKIALEALAAESPISRILADSALKQVRADVRESGE